MNGWQRLWVVVCILVAIPLMTMGELLVPSKEAITQKFDKQLSLERKYLDEIKEKRFDTDPTNQFLFGGTALQDTEARILDLETRYKSELDSLWFDKFKIRGIFVLLLLAICIGLYSVGLVIGWIYRGFRPKKAQ